MTWKSSTPTATILSKLFTSGTQKRDDRFDKLYKQFFCEIRGPEALIKNTSQSLANRYKTDPKIRYAWSPDKDKIIPTVAFHSPTQQLVESLKKIIEEEYRNYYLFCRVFPKCSDTMKSIFQDLLML
ncbi:MAG: hypothetical protein P0S93_04120 [Candidatus Neptunochlamydia sp.]|nr:hypothetical protein [Candidatus Neptunochlamydia sp.]